MGESFGLYKMGDAAACGFHASDPLVMRRTVRLAKERGVRVGAHPSLPDLPGVALLGMAGTTQEAVYESRAIPFVREFYADLDYDETGNLIITREHAAVDAEAAAARTMRAIREGKVRSVTGKDVPVVVESVCVHSGTRGAVAVAREVHRAIEAYLS
jgi:lactam utilization protein B